MKTTLLEEDGKLVMTLEGRLDTAASPQVEKEMEPLIACKDKDVVLDCTTLDYISSSGLRLFLTVLKSVKQSGHKVLIKGINNDIRNVFAMTGFINLFEFV